MADNTRTKRPRNTKIGGEVVHLTGNNAHQFQGQRSKLKVTRPTNAHTVNAQYLQNGKAYELQTWYRRQSIKTRISDKRRDFQGQRSRSQGHVTRLTGVGR